MPDIRFRHHGNSNFFPTIPAYILPQASLGLHRIGHLPARIIAAKGDDWLSERVNAAQYATNWPYNTYGDAQYIEHVMRYYHNDIDYIGAKVRIDGKLLALRVHQALSVYHLCTQHHCQDT